MYPEMFSQKSLEKRYAWVLESIKLVNKLYIEQ